MGCGCGKGKALPRLSVAGTSRKVVVDVADMRTYTNASPSKLYSRNPRFSVLPGETVEIDQETISHQVRQWIRSGVLKLEPAETKAKAAAAKKPAAKKKTAVA
jgi:hypothetical protein